MINISSITKEYNGERVLNGVSLDICDGEFLSIMGESGSGKSTLLNIIGGFLRPDSGKVLWNGEDIFAYDEKKTSYFRSHDMGFVFQSFKLISTLTAKDNVYLPALVAKCAPAEIDKKFAEFCKALGTENIMDKYPSQLSGGQQQRVAIIRALVYSPSVIVLDEPTGALDSAMQRRVMELLSSVNKKYGTTVIQVTHSEEMAKYGTKIVHIKDGEICG